MAMLVVGEALGVKERTAGNPATGDTWQETVIVLLVGMSTVWVQVASVDKFRGALPEQGEVVALDVKVRPYAKRDGTAGYSLVAFGRNEPVETSYRHRVAASA